MKRFFSLFLVLCLICPAALAEEEKPRSFWDSVGGWFSQTAEDVSDWASGAWKDASKWVKGAWGDASQWVEQAWNDSAEWVTDIWGDVADWATDAYDSASDSAKAWWAKTFNTVTKSTENAWNWLTEEIDSLKPEVRENLDLVREAASAAGDSAEAAVRDAFDQMLAKLDLNENDARKVWETVSAYADQKGISRLTAARLALPYLLQLTIDSAESDTGIPAVAIAQYLTAIMEKQGVGTDETADELVEQLRQALEAE